MPKASTVRRRGAEEALRRYPGKLARILAHGSPRLKGPRGAATAVIWRVPSHPSPPRIPDTERVLPLDSRRAHRIEAPDTRISRTNGTPGRRSSAPSDAPVTPPAASQLRPFLPSSKDHRSTQTARGQAPADWLRAACPASCGFYLDVILDLRRSKAYPRPGCPERQTDRPDHPPGSL